MLDTTENYYLGDAVTDEHETLEVSFEISRETLIRHYEADLLFAVEKLGIKRCFNIGCSFFIQRYFVLFAKQTSHSGHQLIRLIIQRTG